MRNLLKTLPALSLLVLLFADVGVVRCSVPDHAACLSSFEGEKFGTDDAIISCVSRASRTCCNAVS